MDVYFGAFRFISGDPIDCPRDLNQGSLRTSLDVIATECSLCNETHLQLCGRNRYYSGRQDEDVMLFRQVMCKGQDMICGRPM